MSISLLQSTHAMGVNLSTPFGVTGGIAPYTYAVVPGGAGGSINASSGLYTSGNGTGPDIITVTDSTSPTPLQATGTIVISTPLELVCDIIQTAMGLSNGQVYLWDQKINVPNDSRLYIAVGIQTCKPFGNKPKYDGSGSELLAVQSVNMLANLSIDILSRGPAARDQKEQVLLALSSPYAQQQMELNCFFIAPISTSFVNLSQIEGAAIPYRFNISVNLQYVSTLSTATEYFNAFATPTVTDEP